MLEFFLVICTLKILSHAPQLNCHVILCPYDKKDGVFLLKLLQVWALERSVKSNECLT